MAQPGDRGEGEQPGGREQSVAERDGQRGRCDHGRPGDGEAPFVDAVREPPCRQRHDQG
jgi:hypothetical protein